MLKRFLLYPWRNRFIVSQQKPTLDTGPSIGRVGRLIAGSLISSLWSNKIASILSVVAFAIILPLTFGVKYDERPRYRQVLLPRVQVLEESYFNALERAEVAVDKTARLYHFLDAHRRALDVLEYVSSRSAVTAEGKAAHLALIRYYELVDEHFAILRSEISVHDEIDYLERWEQIKPGIQLLYARWASWVGN